MLRKRFLLIPCALALFLAMGEAHGQSNGVDAPHRSRLGFRIAADGSMTGSFSIEPLNYEYYQCESTLFARTSDGNLSNLGPVKKLFRVINSSRINRFRASGIRRAVHGANCKPNIVHLIARSRCRYFFNENDVYINLASNVASRYLTCGAAPALEIGPWMDDFSRRVQAIAVGSPVASPSPSPSPSASPSPTPTPPAIG